MISPARYTCYRAAGPIAVDGRLDEPGWQLAPKSAPFVDIVTGEPAWFDTRVALLWDDDNLYFGFWVEETDVWGTMTRRDSKIWEENDVEVFIAGADAYYEFEINALNTVYEVFWIWKDIHAPARRMDVLPDPEHLVDRVERVDFEFVIRVRARDKHLDVVLFPDLRIAHGHRAPHVGLLDPESEIEVVVVPEKRDARVEPRGLTGHDIDERRALRRELPARLVQAAVDRDRTGGAVAGI